MGTPILYAAAITSAVGRYPNEIAYGNSYSCIRGGSNTRCRLYEHRYPPQSRVAPTTPPMTDSGYPVPPEKLVAFVERAYEYAHQHGQEAALQEFNNQMGRLVEGELYIFAYDTKGNTLALPFNLIS